MLTLFHFLVYYYFAGAKHRHVESGQFEKTPEARINNSFFARMAYIMRWAKEKNPHLIVVIENPVGVLSKMPLMKELEATLGLYSVIVNYCAFGRDDKKPTYIWTNVSGALCVLPHSSIFLLPHVFNN